MNRLRELCEQHHKGVMSMTTKKSKWVVSYEMDGGEYLVKITIQAAAVEAAMGETKLVADGVEIELGEGNCIFDVTQCG